MQVLPNAPKCRNACLRLTKPHCICYNSYTGVADLASPVQLNTHRKGKTAERRRRKATGLKIRNL
jgi:hypothetical protein